jgi:hypothetical protein
MQAREIYTVGFTTRTEWQGDMTSIYFLEISSTYLYSVLNTV